MVDTSLRNGTDVNTEGQFKGDGIDGKDLTEMGMGAGGGMLIGGLAGGGKGLLIGGASWRDFDRVALAGKETVGGVAFGNRVDDGVEPPAGDDRGERRAVSKSGVGRQTFWRPTEFPLYRMRRQIFPVQ